MPRRNKPSKMHDDFGKVLASLAVNFQEVVHSVLTGNADIAKPQ